MMKRILFLGLALMAGCFLSGRAAAQLRFNQVSEQSVKYQRLISLIDAFYVDTVNLQKLTEDAIVKVLADLDPHSVYISKEEVEDMNEPLEGGFFGIGIQFNILRDTLMVVDVVSGGPAEKVGMRASDRIIAIDGENVAGKKLTNTGVRKRLKGRQGTPVSVTVLRRGERIEFRVIRDMIPIYSVDACYMVDREIGYIKISRFAATTIEEFEQSVHKLRQQGMKDLILDLEGNGGGFLGAAIGIGDHFLDAGKLMVYTEGLSSGRRDEISTAAGMFQDGRLVLMVDGNSASASEIVSGAVQDWDRGVIVGRRSFGKGLVQRQFPLTDGTLVRLTVAHYYTPSGRCIQKPYSGGGEEYQAELYMRYASGEMLNADSIAVNDSLKYYTKLRHRPVYGGGGIIPDVFVPVDTALNYSYMNYLIARNVVGDFVLNYIDSHRSEIKAEYRDFEDYRRRFEVTDAMMEEIVQAGEKAGVKRNGKLLKPILPVFKNQVKALIARDVWAMNEMFRLLNEDNDELKEAIRILKDGTYEKVLSGVQDK